MRTITVAISANPDLALSHPLRCRLVAVNSSNFALLCEFMCYNDLMLKRRYFQRGNGRFRA
jgi:hypothetical protein